MQDYLMLIGGAHASQHVYALAVGGLNRVKYGGKFANTAFNDADFDNAMKDTVSGIFSATGQTHIAGFCALMMDDIINAESGRFRQRADLSGLAVCSGRARRKLDGRQSRTVT